MTKYGAVIVFSACMIQVITFGIATSIGLYNIELLQFYGSSAAETSMVGSINIGVFFGAGPLVSFLMSKMSYRIVALIGACLSSVGLLCIPFAPNILFIDIFYGVFTGLGFCFLYIPSSVLSGLYFDKRRSLATGIVQSGYGLGALVFPFLIHKLIEEYGWKGSIFIVNAINIHNFVFAALLRPIEKQVPMSAESERILPTLKYKSTDGHMERHHSKQSITQSNKLEVLLDFPFLIYFINNLIWNFGTGIVTVLGPEFFTEIGLDKRSAALSFTWCGIGSLSGSLIGGAVGSIKFVNRIILYAFANVSLGCFVLMFNMPLLQTFIGLSLVNGLWSFSLGIILGLLVVVTSDILGMSRLSVGMGYIMLANGIGNIAGPPVAGWLRDHFGTYIPSINLAGAALTSSGILMLVVPLYKRHIHQNSKNKNSENTAPNGDSNL